MMMVMMMMIFQFCNLMPIDPPVKKREEKKNSYSNILKTIENRFKTLKKKKKEKNTESIPPTNSSNPQRIK